MSETKQPLNKRQIELVMEKISSQIRKETDKKEKEVELLRIKLAKELSRSKEYKNFVKKIVQMQISVVNCYHEGSIVNIGTNNIMINSDKKEYTTILEACRKLKNIKVDAEITLNGINTSELNSIMADINKQIAAII